MNALEQARALVAKSTLPPELIEFAEGAYYWNGVNSLTLEKELTPTLLAKTLGYAIKAKTRAVRNEQALPLGCSKYKGLPHLPPEIEWPQGQYFLAQLDLAELAQVDRAARLPSSGRLYLFFNGAGDATVIHWDGEVGELEIRPYPEAATLPHAEHYLDGFVRGAARIELEPYWLFYLNEGDAYDYGDLRSVIPNDLQEQITALLGCPLVKWDSTCRLFGRPHYWQGEDEGWLGPPDYIDEEGKPVWVDEPRPPELLLFEDEFGEGNIHFWVGFEDAARGQFGEAWAGYSGT